MDKTFHFVDTTQVDGSVRKSMRSHVMKGKNVGKTFCRASRLDIATRQPHVYAALLRSTRALNKEENSENPESLCPTTIERNIGNVFLTFPHPLALTSDALKVVNQCKHIIVR
jgi:hypothetical protein